MTGRPTDGQATVAWIDAQGGVAGDMLLGALIGLGVELSVFESLAADLGLGPVRVIAEQVQRGGIVGWSVRITPPEQQDPPVARHLDDILARIGAAKLAAPVEQGATSTFRLLAEAEAAAHGVGPDEVHFHEVGAVDAIIDIVGFFLGLSILGIREVTASPLPVSTGSVTFSHGTHALPAPAVASLLEGIPVRGVDWGYETVTPTGAAILRTAASRFGPLPSMVVRAHGRGAGHHDGPVANLLRIFVGQRQEPSSTDEHDNVLVEANIDDMNPQHYPAAFDALFAAGAVDVFATPILMKKGRPAHTLSALCAPDVADAVADALMANTTSIGCRLTAVRKRALPRHTTTVRTRYGEVPVKISRLGDRVVQARAEHDACSALARANDVPISTVATAAEALALETTDE